MAIESTTRFLLTIGHDSQDASGLLDMPVKVHCSPVVTCVHARCILVQQDSSRSTSRVRRLSPCIFHYIVEFVHDHRGASLSAICARLVSLLHIRAQAVNLSDTAEQLKKEAITSFAQSLLSFKSQT